MKKHYCTKCKNFVGYEVKDRIIMEKIKGETITYHEKVAICKKCGAEIYVSELDDENMKMFWEVYREVNSYAI